MRIVFMGTPDFARSCLRDLHQSNHEVVAVVTAPDKAAGREKKIHSSSVKKYALEEGIDLLQPDKLRDSAFIEELKSYKADVFVVVAFRMLPEVVWQIPPLGTINLHASLLPNYRGAAPIQWAIINGEKNTGMTTFYINDKIDEGKILLQQEIDLNDEMTAGELHDIMLESSGDLLIETLNGIHEGVLESREQRIIDPERIRSAPKLYREDGKIDWNQEAQSVHNRIRGLSPWPGAWSTLKNGEEQKTLKIFKSTLSERPIEAGKIEISNDSLYVGCGSKSVQLLEVQIEGRRRMEVRAMLRGTPHFDQYRLE